MYPRGRRRRVRSMAKVLLIVLALLFGGLMLVGMVRGRRRR
ncbi:MAG: hypothetical protein JWN54_301 [Mycobacterium sp.]|nr:hypothetical protein [Mycobacterium sp.]